MPGKAQTMHKGFSHNAPRGDSRAGLQRGTSDRGYPLPTLSTFPPSPCLAPVSFSPALLNQVEVGELSGRRGPRARNFVPPRAFRHAYDLAGLRPLRNKIKASLFAAGGRWGGKSYEAAVRVRVLQSKYT